MSGQLLLSEGDPSPLLLSTPLTVSNGGTINCPLPLSEWVDEYDAAAGSGDRCGGNTTWIALVVGLTALVLTVVLAVYISARVRQLEVRCMEQ